MIRHALNVLAVSMRPRLPRAPTFEVVQNAALAWYWRERASNGRIVSVAESYDSKYNAKRAAYAAARRVEGSRVKVLD